MGVKGRWRVYGFIPCAGLLSVVILLQLFLLPCHQLRAQEKPAIQKSAKVVLIEGREYYIHKIQKGQTLYSIAKAYDIPLEVIYTENPLLKEGAKAGQEIRIPLKYETPKSTLPKTPVSGMDTIRSKGPDGKGSVKQEKALIDTAVSRGCIPLDQARRDRKFTLVLMLPLYLSEIDSIRIVREDDTDTPSSFKSLRFIQFYEGLMMAADSIVRQGMNLRLYVYDVDEDTVKVRRLLRKPELKEADLIIGLLYGNVFSIVSTYAESLKIPIINPLSNRLEYVQGKSMVFLANPSVKTMTAQIAEFLVSSMDGEQIILVNPAKASEKRSTQALKTELDRLGVEKKYGENLYKELSLPDNIDKGGFLDISRKNFLVFLSNDELQVANFIRKLDPLRHTYQVSLFGMPSWPDFKSIDARDLNAMNFHSFSSSYIDYGNSDVKKFVTMFRKTYYTEPQEFAFQGFDIAFYFINALWKYGKDFHACLEHMQVNSLQTNYSFTKVRDGGYENMHLNIYHFRDFISEKIR